MNFDLLFHDLFLVAVTGASLFVKNPASQQHAANLLQIAQTLLNQIEAQSKPQ